MVHSIRLREGARPYQKAPFRLSVDQKAALEKELQGFIQWGWIGPSKSEWATVALVVPKKDGEMRVCIDYRDLNAISEADAYPLPKIDELFSKLAKARKFTKMDLKSGFHQIPMDEKSKHLTAFRVGQPIGGCSLFEWNMMPMGLSTAPATFQRWMEESTRGLEDIILVYLDDVLVFSETAERHREDVCRVLQRFQELKMRAKLSKCEFEKDEIQFLGHVITQGQVRVDESKLTKLDQWKFPLTHIRQVRQLMGFLSYYRAFIPGFATTTAPLTALLKGGKGKKLEWTAQATDAAEAAKRALWDACHRYAWTPDRPSRVTTDASAVGLGATFEQKVEGVGWAPVAFWSRKMSQAETRYSVTDQEWLAVIEAVTRQWRHWLKGQRFVLRTDHGPLRQILAKKGEEFSNRQLRWFERLADFTFDVEHLPGVDNKAADALSRVEIVSALEIGREAEQQQIRGWAEVTSAAAKDAEYQQERARLSDAGAASRWVAGEEGVIQDRVGRVKVPADQALRMKLVLEAHESPFGGHFGVSRTRSLVERNWQWSTVAADVERIVRSCDVCQRAQGKSKRDEAPLEPLVVSAPWEVVTIDFVSGFVPSVPGRHEGCVVVVDRFSRMMHVKECPYASHSQGSSRVIHTAGG